MNRIKIKILAIYFVDIDKLILKFIVKGKIARIANNTEEEHIWIFLNIQFQDKIKTTVRRQQCVGERRHVDQ